MQPVLSVNRALALQVAKVGLYSRVLTDFSVLTASATLIHIIQTTYGVTTAVYH